MKTINNFKRNVLVLGMVVVGFTACKKDTSTAPEETNFETTLADFGAIAVASSQSILSNDAVTVGSTKSTLSNDGFPDAAADSVYAVGACSKEHRRKPVLATTLPSALTDYLTANYEGFTFIKAFEVTPKIATNLDSYFVAIKFNGKPVALKFDNSGMFIKVLELREGRDMKKPGGQHLGGFFEHRDGKQRDSISLTLLPQTIKQYFIANYPQDTLKGAWLNKDASVVVISKNGKFFGTAFKWNGTFINRIELPLFHGKDKEITEVALPANVLSYLTETYPNYIFKKAFLDKDRETTKGYLVLIDANLTKYAVVFSATGEFLKVKCVR